MQCPGQDSRFWDGEAIFLTPCTKCGNEIEFFKDESARKCSKCGFKMVNPRTDFGCASHCPYAEQCLGEMPPELLAKKQELLVERVAIEMKRYFGEDFKRIGHATRVARYVEKIGEDIEDANPAVTRISGYLHDIGIKESERKYNSSAPKYQHIEGPPVAKEILERLGANEGLVAEICDIIGHHHSPRENETTNFKILYDADLLVNLEEQQKEKPSAPEHLEKVVQNSFLTDNGALLARKMLLG